MIRDKRIRKTDLDRLNAWIAADPAKAWAAMIEQGLEPLTIDRIVSGRLKGAPRPSTQKMFCRASGMAESDLFPFVTSEGKKTA